MCKKMLTRMLAAERVPSYESLSWFLNTSISLKLVYFGIFWQTFINKIFRDFFRGWLIHNYSDLQEQSIREFSWRRRLVLSNLIKFSLCDMFLDFSGSVHIPWMCVCEGCSIFWQLIQMDSGQAGFYFQWYCAVYWVCHRQDVQRPEGHILLQACYTYTPSYGEGSSE